MRDTVTLPSYFRVLKIVLCFPGTCSMWLVNCMCLLQGLFSFSGFPCLPGTLLCLTLLETTSGSTWYFSHVMGTLPLLWESLLNTTASAVTSLPSWASLWLPDPVSSCWHHDHPPDSFGCQGSSTVNRGRKFIPMLYVVIGVLNLGNLCPLS